MPLWSLYAVGDATSRETLSDAGGNAAYADSLWFSRGATYGCTDGRKRRHNLTKLSRIDGSPDFVNVPITSDNLNLLFEEFGMSSVLKIRDEVTDIIIKANRITRTADFMANSCEDN